MLTINSVSGTKCELFRKEACANGSSRFMVKLGIGWLRHFLCFQAAAHLLFLQCSWEKFSFGKEHGKESLNLSAKSPVTSY